LLCKNARVLRLLVFAIQAAKEDKAGREKKKRRWEQKVLSRGKKRERKKG